MQITKSAFNIREALNSLKKRTGLFGEQVMRTETADEFYNVIGTNRNLIINGDLSISQRGNFTAGINISGVGHILDRWKAVQVSGIHSVQHNLNQEIYPGLRTNTLKVTTTTTGISGGWAMEQHVEFPAYYASVTLTLSFWYKSNFNSYVNFYDGANQPQFFIPNSGGVWKKFTRQYTMPTNATALRIEFYPHISNPVVGNFFEFTLVQLERGTVATPFEHRLPQQELALCQRYYYKIQNSSSSNTVGFGGPIFTYTSTRAFGVLKTAVPMRSSPSISFSNVMAYDTSFGSRTITGINVYQPPVVGAIEYYVEYNAASNMFGIMLPILESNANAHIAFTSEI